MQIITVGPLPLVPESEAKGEIGYILTAETIGMEGRMGRNEKRVLTCDGDWEFRAGETGAWEKISVPGCWDALGIARDSPAGRLEP